MRLEERPMIVGSPSPPPHSPPVALVRAEGSLAVISATDNNKLVIVMAISCTAVVLFCGRLLLCSFYRRSHAQGADEEPQADATNGAKSHTTTCDKCAPAPAAAP
eukprot:2563311-Prymnesium_polylepis.1